MATSTVIKLAPVTEISAIASRILGMDMIASMIPMMIMSAGRKKPAIIPTTSPRPRAIKATPPPMIRESLPPKITRENTSLP